MLRVPCDQWANVESHKEFRILPDGLFSSADSDPFQGVHPTHHTGEIAQANIAWVNSGGDLPYSMAEACPARSGLKKLHPRRASELVQPKVHESVPPWRGVEEIRFNWTGAAPIASVNSSTGNASAPNYRSGAAWVGRSS